MKENDNLIKTTDPSSDESIVLLEFYREQIDRIQSDRENWMKKCEKISISEENQYKINWNYKKHLDEIMDLQKKLDTDQLSLYEEREQVLQLKREIAELNHQSVLDKESILHLVTLEAKDEENQYYFRDAIPSIGYLLIKNRNSHQSSSQKNI